MKNLILFTSPLLISVLLSCTTSQSSKPLPEQAAAPRAQEILLSRYPAADQVQHQAFLNWLDRKQGIWERDHSSYENTHDPKFKWTEVHYIPKPYAPGQLKAPAHADKQNIADTAERYFQLFGRDSIKSFLWTGIETGNNLTMDLDYRWDSLDDAGLYVHENRMSLIHALQSQHIYNIRLGMPNHLINCDANGSNCTGWEKFDQIVKDFVANGMRISLDLHHFGIEDRFRFPADKSKPIDKNRSFYLNDSWPQYFAGFSLSAYRRYHDQIKALTLINEPDTTTQFNAGFWNGPWPGFNDNAAQYSVERAINIARAAILARLAIEKEIKLHPDYGRIIFLHSEAAQSKPDDPQFVHYSRFLTSDLILGHPWVLDQRVNSLAESGVKNVDFAALAAKWKGSDDRKYDQLSSLDWAINKVVFSNRTESPDGKTPYTQKMKYTRVVKRLSELRDLHLRFQRETGLSMMSYTILGIDYYMPNESFAAEINANVVKTKPQVTRHKRHLSARNSINVPEKLAPPASSPAVPTAPIKRMRHEPQFYAEDIRAGLRRGLFAVSMDYWQRYPLPMMIAETGTAYFHYADFWCQQMMLEAGALARSGIPFLGMTWYPTVDNFGWDANKAMSRPRSESKAPLPSGAIWLHTGAMPAADTVLNETDLSKLSTDALKMPKDLLLEQNHEVPMVQDFTVKPGIVSFVNEILNSFSAE